MAPNYVKEFRAVHRMTQARLAAELGMSIRAVQDWEGGKTPVPKWLPLVLAAVSPLTVQPVQHSTD